MITESQFIEMFKTQDLINRTLDQDWIKSSYKWTDDITVHAAKAFNYYGWEQLDHTNQIPNIKQIKLKLVAIWSAGMSQLIITMGDTFDYIRFTDLESSVTNNGQYSGTFRVAISGLIEAAAAGRFNVTRFMYCMKFIEMSWEEMYKLYMKNHENSKIAI